jgi:hypothetical protein
VGNPRFDPGTKRRKEEGRKEPRWRRERERVKRKVGRKEGKKEGRKVRREAKKENQHRKKYTYTKCQGGFTMVVFLLFFSLWHW